MHPGRQNAGGIGASAALAPVCIAMASSTWTHAEYPAAPIEASAATAAATYGLRRISCTIAIWTIHKIVIRILVFVAVSGFAGIEPRQDDANYRRTALPEAADRVLDVPHAGAGGLDHIDDAIDLGRDQRRVCQPQQRRAVDHDMIVPRAQFGDQRAELSAS